MKENQCSPPKQQPEGQDKAMEENQSSTPKQLHEVQEKGQPSKRKGPVLDQKGKKKGRVVQKDYSQFPVPNEYSRGFPLISCSRLQLMPKVLHRCTNGTWM